MEGVLNGAMQAVAKVGGFGATVTGMADGPDVETTERYTGGGRVTRQRRLAEKQGRVHEIAVTVFGWKVLLLIDAATKIPLAVNVGPLPEHEALWARALVTEARLHLAGGARLAKVGFDHGIWDGPTLGWLDQQGLRGVAPAKAKMAVTADAHAQAAAGEGVTVGRRVHTVRPGPGRMARTTRLETAVVGLTGLTTDDQDGPPEPECQANRRDCQASPINGVVVRTWQGQADGPGGKTVVRTNAPVQQPLRVFDDGDERRRIENCCLKGAKQPWELGHPPRKTNGPCECMWASPC
jgi:hypothetical protein